MLFGVPANTTQAPSVVSPLRLLRRRAETSSRETNGSASLSDRRRGGYAFVESSPEHLRPVSPLAPKNPMRFCALGNPFRGHFRVPPNLGRSRSFSAARALTINA